MPRHLIAAVCCLLLFSCAAMAQNSEFRIGLGAGIYPAINFASSTIPFADYSPATISIPVQIGESFRLEPEFGIQRYSRSKESSSGTTEETDMFYRIALLLAYQFPHLAGCENVSGYVGPRIGVLPHSQKNKPLIVPETTMSQSGVLVGLVSGGEYFFAKAFSLGGEVSVNFQSFGKPSNSSYDDESTSFITVNTKVAVRWYFL